MFQKLLKHIQYYFFTPHQGVPPWWVNLTVFYIAFFLIFMVWAPIKVNTAEPMKFSMENKDDVFIVEMTGYSYINMKSFSDWMKMEFNGQAYWCNNILVNRTANTKQIRNHLKHQRTRIDNIEILVINKKYCLVTSINEYKNSSSLNEKQIQTMLKRIGPVSTYFLYKLITFILLGFYLYWIYSKAAKSKTQS
ncbi:hypothetical protein LVJ82_13050 [Vitreoscilla massiliensis]|uniref:Uncharacterized protein n=1 Tax=Vitreoscilla massiliensis TaxID=1689272 RepID=A0ABY4E0S3_9NEIS|nr:hypothetical protein [Vitreoscilla massiliensis]UOO88395.1 hypothetical protein LVJ82_13050 [Vitreoscilla massiliensis]